MPRPTADTPRNAPVVPTLLRGPARAVSLALAVALAVLAGAGCAQPGEAAGAPTGLGPGERIVELASGRELSADQLLAALRRGRYVLLGEVHDNAVQHARRGALLGALRPAAVVAEQLPRGQTVQWGPALLPSLTQAGFDPQGWGWPLHEALFAPLASLGLRLEGGNAPRAQVRNVAREGEAALPAELRSVIAAAPLSPEAREALDEDLVEGHCGQLAGMRLDGMRWAQRARDASMWLALRDAAATAGPAPVALVAGNGHVRTDFGVPQIASALEPGSRPISVGFLEAGTDVARAPFTYVWITAPAAREDPCTALRARRAAVATAAGGSGATGARGTDPPGAPSR